jgi:ATP-dependent helicase HrpB
VALSDPRLGIDRLELRRISRASAEQRAGRAGRTAPGRCLRLWTRAEDGALAPAELPEIHRVDLAGPLLALRAFGVSDPARFAWFEPPRPEALERAETLLRRLGALAP